MNPDAEPKLPAYAFCTPEQAKKHAKYTEQGHYDLHLYEVFWKDRYGFLKENGYLLRQRYSPSWIPSWIGTLRDPNFCEDSIRPTRYKVIDATRISDGERVAIKIVSRLDNEISIARLLSTDAKLQIPENHCVPIYDVLEDPIDSGKALLIMKFLRPFDDPALRTIGEVIDFISQTLEGLAFIHSQGVAHRDCAAPNIMMDGQPLFPQGHHPMRLDYLDDGVRDAPFLNRHDHPVRYYFIDFGLSSHFEENQPPLVVGTKGRDKDPPELDKNIPYNPFLLDIFVLGNLYLKEFVENYYGLEFLEPLITAMIHPLPDQRPTAETALHMFEHIRFTLTESTLRWRLRSRTESAPERVVYDTMAAAREGVYRIKRMII